LVKLQLSECLKGFNSLMSQTAPSLIGAQTLALKNFSSMMHDLARIFDISELASVACTFLCSIPYEESKKQLNQEKLNLLHELISGSFYKNPEARTVMMPTLLNLLSLHIDKSPEEVLQCAEILGVIFDYIQTKTEEADKPLATWELVPLLPQLMAAKVDTPERQLVITACILSFFHLLEPYMFDQYADYLGEAKDTFMMDLLALLEEMLRNSFPSNWFTLCMLQYTTTLKVIRILIPHIKPEHGEKLWGRHFRLCLSLLNCPGLQLEKFPPAKQERIRAACGDMRIDIASILTDTWGQLNSTSSPPKSSGEESLVSMLIEPSLEMLTIPVKAIKELGLKFYISLLEREFRDTGAFDQVATKTIDVLDRLANTGDDLYRLLLPALEEKFKGSSAFCQQGMLLLKDLKQLSDLLNDLRMLPEDQAYENERVIATMKLMEYLKQTDRKDSYVKYVHLLANQHVTSKNFTEAAITVLLHADLLDWTDTMVDAQPAGPFPRQKMCERKEQLIRLAVDYFDKGKNWEDAIAQVKKLAHYYQTKLYDYKELGNLLRKEAQLYENIIGTERFYPEYFRVGFYGKGFPASLSGKEYIYRGTELERISEFTSRIQAKFPKAELLKTTETPSAEIINAPGQFLLITTVTPSSMREVHKQERDSKVAAGEATSLNTGDDNGDLLTNKSVPRLIRNYYKYNNVSVFLSSRPFSKLKVKLDNEFKDLWIKKSFLVTEVSFPAIHRSSEIIKRYEFEATPIETAISAIENKTEELLMFIEKHSNEKGINISPFTMALNGVIDAAVNGGVKKYQDFLTPQYSQESPQMAPFIALLREALNTQLQVVERGVKLHETIVQEEMMDLHRHMVTQFEKLKLQIAGSTHSKLEKLL
jgi:hypothetical protein